MSKDIIVIIGYIIIVALLCVIWNKFMMRQYNFNNTQSSLVHNAIMRCSVHIDQMTDLTLAGNGPDQNNDYEFIDAVKRTSVSNNTRIKLND